MGGLGLSAEDTRRVALAAQGFGVRRPARPGLGAVLGTARRLQALQIDAVNVLVTAHYLPVFSRLGAYDRGLLDRLTNQRHDLIEHRHGHQASFVPVELEPLLRWRVPPSDGGWRRGLDPAYVAAVEEQVVTGGPLTVRDLEDAGRRHKPAAADMLIRRKDGQPYAESSVLWHRSSDGKAVLDGLVREGRLALAGRRGVERLYDLVERVLPPEVRSTPTPTEEDAQRELVLRSARSLGVATVADLASTFLLPSAATRRAARELCAAGVLQEVAVEGWPTPAFLADTAAKPRPVTAAALLGPFDSLTWSRDRTRRIFGFEFSFEIYVPEPKRRYGYYVLPFLLDERLVARVDLKADRKASRLIVASAHLEPGVAASDVTGPLSAELERMATWLDLADVDELAPALR